MGPAVIVTLAAVGAGSSRRIVRNRLQRAHAKVRGRVTGSTPRILLSAFVWSRLIALLVLAALLTAELPRQLRTAQGAVLLFISPICSLSGQFKLSARQYRENSRERFLFLFYDFNIILVMLIGRKHKRHLCHHLGPYSSSSKPGSSSLPGTTAS